MKHRRPKVAEFLTACAFRSDQDEDQEATPLSGHPRSLALMSIEPPSQRGARIPRQGKCVGVAFYRKYVFIHFQGQHVWKCVNSAMERIVREQGQEWPWALLEYDHDSLKALLDQYAPSPVEEMGYASDWLEDKDAPA